jgi:Pectate lyase superfamily protein
MKACRLVGAAIAALVLGSVARAQVGKTIIDVKSVHVVGTITYPAAAGDGTTDDTSAIQGCIEYARYSAVNRNKGRGAVIFFPEGTYRITDTIKLYNDCEGIDLVGASNNTWTWSGSVPPAMVVGDMAASGHPMFALNSAGNRFSDLVIGARKTVSSVIPPAIIQTAYASGPAVSGLRFDHMYFWSHIDSGTNVAGTAVSMGSSSTDSTNSEIIFRNCSFSQFATGIVVNTQQGLDYVLEQVGADHCATFLDLTHGGNVSVNVATFSACGGTGSTDWIFKVGDTLPNGGMVRITNARFESGCQQFVRVDGLSHVLLEGISENTSPTRTGAALELGSGVLMVHNSSFITLPVLNFCTPIYSWALPSVRFRDCSLPLVAAGYTPPIAPVPPATPPSTLLTGTGNYTYQDCMGYYSNYNFYPFANATNVTGW